MSRLPETGPSLQRYLRRQARTAQRQQQSSAFNLSGVSVTAEDETTVVGTLNLKSGSITDAELANPAIRQAVNLTTTDFAPTATWAEVVGVDLTVPTDYTQLLVTASAWVYAVNNSAAADNLNARVSLDAVNGQAFLTPLPIAGFGTISAGVAVLADSLAPGATLRLSARAKTTTGTWTTDAANTATLVASLTWLR